MLCVVCAGPAISRNAHLRTATCGVADRRVGGERNQATRDCGERRRDQCRARGGDATDTSITYLFPSYGCAYQ